MQDRNNNDHHDKYDSESEYEFSDDGDSVSYGSQGPEHPQEENKSPEGEVATGGSGGQQPGGGSKRIIIGVAAFIIVIAIVYQFIKPTTTIPSTDITELASVTNQPAPMQANVPRPPIPAQAQLAAQNQPPAPAQPGQPAMQQTVVPAQTNVIPLPPTGSSQPQPVVASTPTGLPLPGGEQAQASAAATPAPSAAPQTAMLVPATQQTQPAQPVPPVGSQYTNNMPPTMPAVIPVQTVQPQATEMTSQPVATSLPAGAMEQMAAMQTQNAERMKMMQEMYTQEMNQFSDQNKQLQEQIKTLSTRVNEMEAALQKVVKSSTEQMQQQPNQGAGNAPASSSSVMPPAQTVESANANYSVQAIIPGRAWLRSQSGETVTVAEGDVIRDLGRVTKVDPYDGIVEINTGNKVLTLSYGNNVG